MIALLNRLYRNLFCRGGYGVHSPFVFDLLTTVIEERKYYYCYDRIHPVRLQVMQRREEVMYGNLTIPIKKALEKYGFTELEHRLLFRLANRFQPKTILSIGSDFGITPLYLTAYAADCACIVIESDASVASVAREYIEKYATATVELRQEIGETTDNLDFVVFSACPFNDILTLQLFERLLPHIHDESIMVISGINASLKNRKTWQAICAHPKVTVTINLYRIGIVFFNPKLNRQTYKSCI